MSDPIPGHGSHLGKLAIPYLDHNGKTLQVRFRCLQPHNCRELGHGKYMTLAGDPARMYGVGSLHRAIDEIHVTEGELDALILAQLGWDAVAIPGAKNYFGRHRRLLAGFGRIWVWGDPDDAGAELNQKITRGLARARAVNLRIGDVTDTYLAEGPDALYALCGKEAPPPWDE